VDKPTVLVLDNAPTHRATNFLEKIHEWMERDLFIFFLPKYSPHLNKAEIYWRKAKYEWLRPTDYYSFSRYKQKIREIFGRIGVDYKIKFAEMSV
jgi:transposase